MDPWVKQNGRSEELNGLRGLAALIVVFCHYFSLFPDSRWTFLWKVSPLSLLTSGRGSVVIFFVLSGFALHRMVLKVVPFRYPAFALRRITRIYGPYLAALLLAVAGNVWLSHGVREGFSDWFNQTWVVPINQANLWQHIAFLGEYNTKPLNCAIWSLVHETRISLLFPLLLLVVKKRSAVWSACAALVCFTTGSLLMANSSSPNSLGESLHYAGLFVVGIYISEHQQTLRIWFRSQSEIFQNLFTTGAAALFCYGRFASRLFPYGYGEMQDIPVGLAAAALVVAAFSSKSFSTLLLSKPVDWLGNVSYSLYLVHGTVLFSLVNILNLAQPTFLLLPVYLLVALLAAHLFYLAIERPMVLLSRKFTGKNSPHKTANGIVHAEGKSLHYQ
jgi:peptidoglycan/LPS O-acetylase OafA/YrhL